MCVKLSPRDLNFDPHSPYLKNTYTCKVTCYMYLIIGMKQLVDTLRSHRTRQFLRCNVQKVFPGIFGIWLIIYTPNLNNALPVIKTYTMPNLISYLFQSLKTQPMSELNLLLRRKLRKNCGPFFVTGQAQCNYGSARVWAYLGRERR